MARFHVPDRFIPSVLSARHTSGKCLKLCVVNQSSFRQLNLSIGLVNIVSRIDGVSR